MKKPVLSLMILTAIFAVALCGCNNESAGLKQRIDGLEESNSRLEERVDELEKENDRLWEMLYESGYRDGEFYTLQQAYDSGLLTLEDLKSIAYYHNGGIEGNDEVMGADFQPQPKTPEVVDKITRLSIKQTYCNNLRQENAKPSDVTIEKYYGTYNGCYAVLLDSIYVNYFAVPVDKWETVGGVQFHYTDHMGIDIWKATQGEDIDETLATQIKTDYAKYGEYDSNDLRLSVYGEYNGTCVMFIDGPWLYMDVITTETVGGVEFVYSSSRTLKAYNGGTFYSLGEAYENQLLSRDDLLNIHAKYEGKQFTVY